MQSYEFSQLDVGYAIVKYLTGLQSVKRYVNSLSFTIMIRHKRTDGWIDPPALRAARLRPPLPHSASITPSRRARCLLGRAKVGASGADDGGAHMPPLSRRLSPDAWNRPVPSFSMLQKHKFQVFQMYVLYVLDGCCNSSF
jgi:hypothetical protein